MDHSLTCPRCQIPLKEVKTLRGIFWKCGNCDGRAVTVELLRRTFTNESINPLWLHAIRGEGRSSAPCPQCKRPMVEVALSDKAAVNVDVCNNCHFVWFDAHEVDTLVARPLPSPQPEVPQKVREMLAIEKVKELAEQAQGSDWDSAPPDEWWKQIAAFLGMPIEFDEPEKSGRPWATWILAATIIVVSAFAFTNLREIVQQFGLIPAQATRLGGLTFVTAFFLHGGVIHLLGNMYFLLVFGDNVEDFLRRTRYLAMIAVAAFVGDFIHIAADPHAQIPCIGASGGIAGVIVFYALKFPHIHLAFLMRWGFVWFRWIRLPAWFALVLWILFQILGAWEQKAGISSVSSFAHLGGAAVGVVAWWMWRDLRSNDEARMSNVEAMTKSE
jgi:membrane associated rhomboid family serine protease/Zn-finger nucleic acid-binding protein